MLSAARRPLLPHAAYLSPLPLCSPSASSPRCSYGFSRAQVCRLLSSAPEVLVTGSPFTAGRAVLRLKAHGFSDTDILNNVLPFCPQVLSLGEQEISTLVRLWSKFSSGIDDRPT